MPVEIPQIDVLLQPDLGGRQQPVSPFNETIVIARPIPRIFPTVESQKPLFPLDGCINFNSDLEQLDRLHQRFGGRPEGQRLSHDPVVDRARYERAKTDPEKEAVRQGVIVDMEKNLYERAHTTKSTVVYYQENGRVYNPDFKAEPFDISLQRGLEYSRKEARVDYEREQKEFAGWKKVMAALFDPEAEINSKAIIISGPGLKKGTAFTDNFVDVYTKTLDPQTGRIQVVMVRFASDSSYDEYKKTALNLRADYFESLQAQQDLDVYFIENPILLESKENSKNAQQLFQENFKKQRGALEEEKTKSHIEGCRLFILHYADTVCSEFLNPEKVKEAFRAVLNKFDSLREGIGAKINKFSEKVKDISKQIVRTFKSLQEEIAHFGKMAVKEVKAGCGLSGGGYSIGGGSISESLIASSVGTTGGLSKDKDYCIRCGACGAEIRCVVKRGEKCPKCSAVRKC